MKNYCKQNFKQNECKTVYKVLFSVSLCLFIASIGLRIYCSSNMAVRNNELKALYDKKLELEKEITNLTYIDSNLSSLKYVEKNAFDLGFIKMDSNLKALDPYASTSVAVLSKQ